MSLESVALVDLDEAGVGQEHGSVSARLDGLGDAHGVQRGPKAASGKNAKVFCGMFVVPSPRTGSGRVYAPVDTAGNPLAPGGYGVRRTGIEPARAARAARRKGARVLGSGPSGLGSPPLRSRSR